MSYFQGMNPLFNNPVYGSDSAGKFGQTGANLGSNPFGGVSLNVGGFGGNIPGYGGTSGGFGQAAGLLGLANLGLGMMGMSNTGQSLQSAYDTAGVMADIEMGKNLFAQNKDIFNQKDFERWATKYKLNDPMSRQYDTLQALRNPGIAGRYSAFVS